MKVINLKNGNEIIRRKESKRKRETYKVCVFDTDQTETQKDREQTERQSNIHIDRKTDRQKDSKTVRHKDREQRTERVTKLLIVRTVQYLIIDSWSAW